MDLSLCEGVGSDAISIHLIHGHGLLPSSVSVLRLPLPLTVRTMAKDPALVPTLYYCAVGVLFLCSVPWKQSIQVGTSIGYVCFNLVSGTKSGPISIVTRRH